MASATLVGLGCLALVALYLGSSVEAISRSVPCEDKSWCQKKIVESNQLVLCQQSRRVFSLCCATCKSYMETIQVKENKGSKDGLSLAAKLRYRGGSRFRGGYY